jgi:hypothetical protein
MAPVHGDGILHHAVIHHVQASQQGSTTRTTGDSLGKVMAERYPVSAQGIQVRRAQAWMPEDGERVASPLVYDDQEHILLLAHCCSPSLYLPKSDHC